MPTEPKIHLVFCGDRGHGKSSLIGRLLYDTGRIPAEQLAANADVATRMGRHGSHFAWILDTSPEERERGFTSDIHFHDLRTAHHVIWAIDTPGHEDHIDRVATGLSEADAGVLVVASDHGVTARTEEHAVLAHTLGVHQLIVAMTKMDLVNYSESRYQALERDLRSLLLEIGFEDRRLTFVPMSALTGANIFERGRNLRWFQGPTFQEAIDRLAVPRQLITLPFRLPIDTVYYKPKPGIIVCGKIATGQVRPGENVVIEPGHALGTITSIQEMHEEGSHFQAGDNIGVLLNGIDSREVIIGYVMGHPDNPPSTALEIRALINILHYPVRLHQGQALTMLVHTASVPVTIDAIVSKLDPRSDVVVEERPPFLRTSEKGVVYLRTNNPVVIEYQDSIPQLSRFVLRDFYRPIAAGVRLRE